MPQTWTEWLRGYAHLTIDTLTQRLVNTPSTPPHAIFRDGTYLHGQTAIVTGANTGIGLETTRMLAHAGAHVILGCRNVSKAEQAVADIRSTCKRAELSVVQIDLASLQSVRRFVDTVCSRGHSSIDMLVLNGGVMGVGPHNPETHFMVNHVAHALLTVLLLPLLARARAHARIVFVSSLTLAISDLRFDDLHFNTRRYNWMTAYANSKLLMVQFMRELCNRLKAKSEANGTPPAAAAVIVNAVHPGETPSDVARNLGPVWYFLHKTFGPLFLLSVPQSARTSVFAAGAKEVVEGGRLFHRVSEVLDVSAHLLGQEDLERAWDVTLSAAGVSKDDIKPLQDLLDWGHSVGS